MRALLAIALLAPLALAQEPAPAPAPAEPPKPEIPQLVPPDPLPGEPLPEGAEWQTTASGLRWVMLHKGDEQAARPTPDSMVTVYYRAFLESGTQVDERMRDAEPLTYPLKRFIAGWGEGLQLMHPGDKLKFLVPWQLAYKERGSPPLVPAFANMVFDIELVSFVAPPAFSMPADADLTTTASGLRYQVLKAGTGAAPEASDMITVHYTGWLTDGNAVDSSFKAGKPATMKLGALMKGWIEGVQLMQEGAVYKFVIPPGLAYGDQGRGGVVPPNATLVFQIELIKVGG
jgi:FKBP-type peptidyl-prolyl cis-trans isomerase